jgi:RNA polymerase sigma-70 factor (ECF subfamily)
VNRRAFETLIRTHQAEIYRYMCYLGAGPNVAEDLVQETFLVALEKGQVPEEAPAAWLRGVARNMFLRYCRDRRTDPVQLTTETLDRFEEVWSNEFLRDGDGFDYMEALRACVRTLSQKQRSFIDLRYRLGKSRAEMARLCRMTEDGVKTLLRRIRTEVVKCIRRRLKLEETDAT